MSVGRRHRLSVPGADYMEPEAYRQLPIPAWLDLNCPRCSYPLRGLPEHRCPECGLRFDIEQLLTTATPLRPPRIGPDTRPVPDLGLLCARCDSSLRGVREDRCPACGEPFDLAAAIPDDVWPDLTTGLGPLEGELIFAHLRDAGIPCRLARLGGRMDAILGHGAIGPGGAVLRVRRDYYLDALHVLQNIPDPELPSWRCDRCGECVPGNFDVCWNCQTAKGNDSAEPGTPPRTQP